MPTTRLWTKPSAHCFEDDRWPKSNSREQAARDFAASAAGLHSGRALAEWAEQVEYAGLLRTADSARDADNAAYLAALEVARAESAQSHALDVASAEQDFQVAKAEGTESAATHKTAVADALLAHTTRREDAKLTFQTAESTARQTYSEDASLAERDRAIDLAGIAKNAATTAAGYQAAVDAAFAAAERTYWGHRKVSGTDKTNRLC